MRCTCYCYVCSLFCCSSLLFHLLMLLLSTCFIYYRENKFLVAHHRHQIIRFVKNVRRKLMCWQNVLPFFFFCLFACFFFYLLWTESLQTERILFCIRFLFCWAMPILSALNKHETFHHRTLGSHFLFIFFAFQFSLLHKSPNFIPFFLLDDGKLKPKQTIHFDVKHKFYPHLEQNIKFNWNKLCEIFAFHWRWSELFFQLKNFIV